MLQRLRGDKHNRHKNLICRRAFEGSNDFSAFSLPSRPRFSRGQKETDGSVRGGKESKETIREEETWAVVSGRNEDRAISYRTPSARKQFIPLHCSTPYASNVFLHLSDPILPADFWSYTFLARFSCGVRNSKNAADDINDTFGKQCYVR